MADLRICDHQEITSANAETHTENIKEIFHLSNNPLSENQICEDQKSNINNESDFAPIIKEKIFRLFLTEKIIVFCGIGIIITSLLSLIIFSEKIAFYFSSAIITLALSISIFKFKKYKKNIRRSTN